jgi:hypothetical protein
MNPNRKVTAALTLASILQVLLAQAVRAEQRLLAPSIARQIPTQSPPPASAFASQSAGIVQFPAVQGEPGDAPLSEAEIQAIDHAANIANAVKNSDCFRRFIAGRQMIETNGATADQVAANLQSLHGVVPVAFYYRCNMASVDCREPTQAVAYRQPPQIKIFINRAHFDVTRSDFDLYELAGTFAHEGFGHLLGGYGHSFAWTETRDFSVPYSISGASRANDDAFQHCRKSLGF